MTSRLFRNQFLVHVLQSRSNHYSTLGLNLKADKKDIKAAYINLAQKLHPDKNLDNPEAQEKFQKVQEAYVILSENKSRREYDQEHRAGELRKQKDDEKESKYKYSASFDASFRSAGKHTKMKMPEQSVFFTVDPFEDDYQKEKKLKKSLSINQKPKKNKVKKEVKPQPVMFANLLRNRKKFGNNPIEKPNWTETKASPKTPKFPHDSSKKISEEKISKENPKIIKIKKVKPDVPVQKQKTMQEMLFGVSYSNPEIKSKPKPKGRPKKTKPNLVKTHAKKLDSEIFDENNKKKLPTKEYNSTLVKEKSIKLKVNKKTSGQK